MIQNNPELNKKINQKNKKDTDYGGSIKYCILCGKPIIYTKSDKYGNYNSNREREWQEGVCHNCWPEFIRRQNSIRR
jgi:hypothetical protein